MRLIGTACITALIAGAALAGQAQRVPAPVSDRPVPAPARVSSGATLPATQALFDSYIRDRKMPGIVGAFGMGASPTLFPSAGRIGDGADAAAAGPDTLWRVYSMTKPITGMAAMMLIEDGKLGLDQPIGDFFPQFKSMRVMTNPATSLDSRPATRAITVRHLLTHTAGLGYSILGKGPLPKEYERRGLVAFSSDARTEPLIRPTRPASLQAFAERAAELPLLAEPGTAWNYSIGLDILGAVIERASGMSFDRFVQTRLFDPLKMRSSFWQVLPGAADRLADNYAWVGSNRVPIDPARNSVFLLPAPIPFGGAGLVMSARDYDRFLHMLANGGTLDGARVMKAETVRLGMSNLLPAGVRFGGVGGERPSTATPMGFGAGGSVFLADAPGGFPGKGTYGWSGAAGTIGFVDPSRGFRATVMVNYFPAEKWPLRREVGAALMADAVRLHGGIPSAPRR
ncbi:MAG TPA: serine hydrolase domain-containing protein [Sphingomonas sp.]|jgi:CubicO group peptidase (beta-lactamase class C family)